MPSLISGKLCLYVTESVLRNLLKQLYTPVYSVLYLFNNAKFNIWQSVPDSVRNSQHVTQLVKTVIYTRKYDAVKVFI